MHVAVTYYGQPGPVLARGHAYHSWGGRRLHVSVNAHDLVGPFHIFVTYFITNFLVYSYGKKSVAELEEMDT